MKASQFLELTKPKVLVLMNLTTLAGIALSPTPLPSSLIVVMILLGQMLVAGSGAVFNHIFDRNLDKQMKRTSHRPLAKGEIPLNIAICYGLGLWMLGSFFIFLSSNPLTWVLTTCTAFGYAVIYTRYLKYASPQNIAIGGIYGAVPPLLGWVACTNQIDPAALILAGIIFTWTPPHFWALAIKKRQEYAGVGIPMLPVTHGVEITSYFIVFYTVLLWPICTILWLLQICSIYYEVIMSILTLFYFVINCLLITNPEKYAFISFKISILYLYLLFIVMISDHFYWRYLC